MGDEGEGEEAEAPPPPTPWELLATRLEPVFAERAAERKKVADTLLELGPSFQKDLEALGSEAAPGALLAQNRVACAFHKERIDKMDADFLRMLLVEVTEAANAAMAKAKEEEAEKEVVVAAGQKASAAYKKFFNSVMQGMSLEEAAAQADADEKAAAAAAEEEE